MTRIKDIKVLLCGDCDIDLEDLADLEDALLAVKRKHPGIIAGWDVNYTEELRGDEND